VKLTIFFLISLALAIPTFGISLLVYWFIRNWYFKIVFRSLMDAIGTSFRTEDLVIRHGVNKRALEWAIGGIDPDGRVNGESVTGDYPRTRYSLICENHPHIPEAAIVEVNRTNTIFSKSTLTVKAESASKAFNNLHKP
jgi:hypothetical protein